MTMSKNLGAAVPVTTPKQAKKSPDILPPIPIPTTTSQQPKIQSSKSSSKLKENDIVSAESTEDEIDGKCTQDEDLESAEDEDDHDADLDEDESEEKVRKTTLLSTILMPRPMPKPPFTIEAAMSKFRRKKRSQEEAAQQPTTSKQNPPETKNGGHQPRRKKSHPAPQPPPPATGNGSGT